MRGSINEGTPIAGWFMKPPNVMMSWAWVKLAEKKKLSVKIAILGCLFSDTPR